MHASDRQLSDPVSDSRRGEIAESLVEALDRGDITAEFQPIFDLATGEVVAAETLARWNHPSLGRIQPNEFITVAEDLGLIGDVGTHVFGLACDAVKNWHQAGWNINVSVNVSLLEFRSATAGSTLIEAVERAEVKPASVIVELTESTAASFVPDARIAVNELVDAGFTLSIDGFGAGNSTEHQVRSLPATEVKIDQSLIQDESSNGRLATSLLVRFAKSLGARVVAEGVSTDAQLDRARSAGCDRAQGFLLCPPAAPGLLQERFFLVTEQD